MFIFPSSSPIIKNSLRLRKNQKIYFLHNLHMRNDNRSEQFLSSLSNFIVERENFYNFFHKIKVKQTHNLVCVTGDLRSVHKQNTGATEYNKRVLKISEINKQVKGDEKFFFIYLFLLIINRRNTSCRNLFVIQKNCCSSARALTANKSQIIRVTLWIYNTFYK